MLEIYHETKSELLNEAFGEPEQPRVERRRSTRQAAQEVDEDEEVDLFLLISKGPLLFEKSYQNATLWRHILMNSLKI